MGRRDDGAEEKTPKFGCVAMYHPLRHGLIADKFTRLVNHTRNGSDRSKRPLSSLSDIGRFQADLPAFLLSDWPGERDHGCIHSESSSPSAGTGTQVGQLPTIQDSSLHNSPPAPTQGISNSSVTGIPKSPRITGGSASTTPVFRATSRGSLPLACLSPAMGTKKEIPEGRDEAILGSQSLALPLRRTNFGSPASAAPSPISRTSDAATTLPLPAPDASHISFCSSSVAPQLAVEHRVTSLSNRTNSLHSRPVAENSEKTTAQAAAPPEGVPKPSAGHVPSIVTAIEARSCNELSRLQQLKAPDQQTIEACRSPTAARQIWNPIATARRVQSVVGERMVSAEEDVISHTNVAAHPPPRHEAVMKPAPTMPAEGSGEGREERRSVAGFLRQSWSSGAFVSRVVRRQSPAVATQSSSHVAATLSAGASATMNSAGDGRATSPRVLVASVGANICQQPQEKPKIEKKPGTSLLKSLRESWSTSYRSERAAVQSDICARIIGPDVPNPRFQKTTIPGPAPRQHAPQNVPGKAVEAHKPRAVPATKPGRQSWLPGDATRQERPSTTSGVCTSGCAEHPMVHEDTLSDANNHSLMSRLSHSRMSMPRKPLPTERHSLNMRSGVNGCATRDLQQPPPVVSSRKAGTATDNSERIAAIKQWQARRPAADRRAAVDAPLPSSYRQEQKSKPEPLAKEASRMADPDAKASRHAAAGRDGGIPTPSLRLAGIVPGSVAAQGHETRGILSARSANIKSPPSTQKREQRPSSGIASTSAASHKLVPAVAHENAEHRKAGFRGHKHNESVSSVSSVLPRDHDLRREAIAGQQHSPQPKLVVANGMCRTREESEHDGPRDVGWQLAVFLQWLDGFARRGSGNVEGRWSPRGGYAEMVGLRPVG